MIDWHPGFSYSITTSYRNQSYLFWMSLTFGSSYQCFANNQDLLSACLTFGTDNHYFVNIQDIFRHSYSVLCFPLCLHHIKILRWPHHDINDHLFTFPMLEMFPKVIIYHICPMLHLLHVWYINMLDRIKGYQRHTKTSPSNFHKCKPTKYLFEWQLLKTTAHADIV